MLYEVITACPDASPMRSSVLIALAAAVLLSACSLLPDQKDESADWSAQRLYSEAKDQMASANYAKAIAYLEKLEARYPRITSYNVCYTKLLRPMPPMPPETKTIRVATARPAVSTGRSISSTSLLMLFSFPWFGCPERALSARLPAPRPCRRRCTARRAPSSHCAFPSLV